MNANVICQTQLLSVLTGDSPVNAYTIFQNFNLSGGFLPPVASPAPNLDLENLNLHYEPENKI